VSRRTSLPVFGQSTGSTGATGAAGSPGDDDGPRPRDAHEAAEAAGARAELADPAVIQTVWMRVLMDGLHRAGVTDVVVSPGSRSTPLVFAAEFLGMRCHTIIDERSAAFFALGRSRATGAPTALVCTSGTAGAHYYPALIEAAYAHVPLVVLTADRPPELQGCAAPQTIDQTAFFGHMVRHFVDLGPPEAERMRLRALRRKAIQAVALARGPVPGPVHVNVPARKPLEPAPPRTAADLAMAERGDAVCIEPAPQVFTGPPRAPDAAVDALAGACLAAQRGLIACGPMPPHLRDLGRMVGALARATGFPVLAEAASQVRSGAHFGASFGAAPEQPGLLCDGFEALLASARFRARTRPDLILQIGPPLTSSHLPGLLSENPGAVRCVIAPWGWNDPDSSAGVLVMGDVIDTIERLVARIEARSRGLAPVAQAGPVSPPALSAGGAPAARAAWARRFAAGNALVWRAVDEVLAAGADSAVMREGQAMRAALAAVPAGALLALGNSLPIRTVDTYGRARPDGPAVLSQRGANGIDGLISSAAGAASATSRPVALILGDVSFAHDIGGLASARLVGKRASLAVIVIDNQGGRIFEQLPIAERGGALFSTHWLTPPACDVQAAAAVFGHAYVRAENAAALSDAVAAALRPGAGCTVIHAVVAPESATADARRIQALVGAGVDELPGGEPGTAQAGQVA
jgi:2-succinyl-5-enolpyruvyl-6-hydroxy-3-cyclohexene-1-carboxylate synthase